MWPVVLRRGVVSVRIPLVTLKKTCIICHFPAFYFLFSFPAIADDPEENKTGKKTPNGVWPARYAPIRKPSAVVQVDPSPEEEEEEDVRSDVGVVIA